MFDLNNIKKLIDYNWNNIVERITPKDNKEKMDEQTTKDLMSGAILKIAADFLGLIGSILIALVLSKMAEELFGGVNLFGLNEDVSVSISFPITISIAILVYTVAMKEKEQTSLLHFVVLIYILINSISGIFSIITWVAAMFINPIIGFIGLVSVVVNLLGNIFIIVGCLDFCVKTKSAYVKANTIYPDNSGIKTKPININEVSMHTETTCVKCGKVLGSTDNYCKSCGEKASKK